MARWLRISAAALALAVSLSPTSASAEPITIALFGAAFASTFLGGVVSFGISAVISLALSFVAQALFRQPTRASGATPLQGQVTGQKFNVRVAAGPRVVIYGETRVAGTYAFMHTTNDNTYLHLVIMFAGHECAAFAQVTIGEETFNTSDLGDGAAYLDGDGFTTSGKTFAGGRSFARFKFHLGTADQAADQFLIDEVGDATIWGPNHRLRGVCYIYARLEFGPTGPQRPLFSDGLPNITAVIRGKKVYDPRSATTDWSANSALCLADYLCDTTYGVGVDYATSINETALIAAANACDEDVTLQSGGTENRFETNGSFESSQQPQAVIGWLLGAMHGRAPYDGERWTILAGVYQSPTITLTENDLRAGMTINTVSSRRDLINAVKGTFTDPANNWQEYDFPPVTSEAGATADGGVIWKDIALPFTTSASMAQRLAKIDLLRARKQITVAMPCKLTAWLVQAGDTVNLTYDRWGWSAKPFEVRRARFVMEDGEGGPILGVDLDLVEISSDVYSWDTSEEQLTDSVPRTNLPNIRDVIPPTNLTVEESLYSTLSSNGVKTRADLSWAASPDGFVNLYQPEYKLHADSEWHILARVAGLATIIADLEPGLYDFRVAAVNFAGFVSDYTTHTREISGIGAPPADATGFTAIVTGGVVILRWNKATDLDVLIGGHAVFRFSPAVQFDIGSEMVDETAVDDFISEDGDQLVTEDFVFAGTPAWDAAMPLAEVAGSDAIAVMEARAGSYLLKFRDASGNYSTNFAIVFITRAELGDFEVIAYQVEDPDFAGTKVDCSVAGGILSLDAGEATATYDWSATIDLGGVASVRITIGAETQVVSNTDLMDDWPDVDARARWDPAIAGNEAHALHYVSWTTDDPSGTPNWTDYQQIISADFRAWSFRFRTVMTATDTNYGIQISQLNAVVEHAI